MASDRDDKKGGIDPTRIPRPLRSALRSEREATIARLQDAVASDDLEMDELEERLDLAMQARNADELRVLVRDLPERKPSTITMKVVAPSQLPAVVAATELATGISNAPAVVPDYAPAHVIAEPPMMSLTAIFSGHDIKGRRIMPREVRVRCVFGGADLDLREATFLPGVTTLRCAAVFGGVNVIVPPHVRVESQGTGIFGGFAADNRDEGVEETDDTPVLRVVGWAVFGGVNAERRRPKQKRLPK